MPREWLNRTGPRREGAKLAPLILPGVDVSPRVSGVKNPYWKLADPDATRDTERRVEESVREEDKVRTARTFAPFFRRDFPFDTS